MSETDKPRRLTKFEAGQQLAEMIRQDASSSEITQFLDEYVNGKRKS